MTDLANFKRNPNAKKFWALFEEWRQLLNEKDISNNDLMIKVDQILLQEGYKDQPAKTYLRGLFERKVKKICNPKTEEKVRGDVEINIEYRDGRREQHDFKNTILRAGKAAVAQCLTRDVNDPFDFYIDSIIFGTNGSVGGTTARYVDDSRTGLFGSTVLSKGVISSIDSNAPATAVFTSVITYDEANGESLSEMALVMKNGDLYSMLTFPDLNKTSNMQLVINWKISIL